jgi:glucokinase
VAVSAQPDPSYLGIDLGGTKILALVATADGQALGEALVPTPAAEGVGPVVEAMALAARQATASAGQDPSALRSMGIAAAGAIDGAKGVVVHSPHLMGWNQVPLVRLLQAHFDLPTIITNDANAAAVGEHRYGAGRGATHLLYITVSTGIGGGIIIGGKLYQGHDGLAGEVGHISVLAGGPSGRSSTAGALEALASGTALVWEARRLLRQGGDSVLKNPDSLTTEDVFAALQQGDELAQRVVERGIQALGAGLTSLVNVLNPELLIIGGGLSNRWREYIEPAVAIMRGQAFAGMGRELQVVPPELGTKAGALGAVALAVEQS